MEAEAVDAAVAVTVGVVVIATAEIAVAQERAARDAEGREVLVVPEEAAVVAPE